VPVAASDEAILIGCRDQAEEASTRHANDFQIGLMAECAPWGERLFQAFAL
jgi:hypothetical protein